MPASDSELHALWLRERDTDAFTEIVYRHGAMVFGACQRILKNGADAEEVAQECFLHLAERGKRIHTSLGGWLHTVATRRSLNRIRSDSRRARREAMYQKDVPAATEARWDDMRELLDEALLQLSSKHRTAVVYRYLEGKTHTECALAMGISPSTAQYRANRGVEQLRKAFSRRGVALSSSALVSMIVSNAAQAMPATLQDGLGAIAILGGEGLATAGVGGFKGVAALLARTGWVKPAAGMVLAVAVVTAAVVLPIAVKGGGAQPAPQIETSMDRVPPPAGVASQRQPSPARVDAHDEIGRSHVDDSLHAAMEPAPEDPPAETSSNDAAIRPEASPPQPSIGGFGGAISVDQLDADEPLEGELELAPGEVLGGLPWGQGAHEPDDGSGVNSGAREVIAAFQDTLASRESYFFRFTNSQHTEYHAKSPEYVRPGLEGKRVGYVAGLLATDGYRVVHQCSTWGDFHGRDRRLSPTNPNYFAMAFDGNEMWQLDRGPRHRMKKEGPGVVLVQRRKSRVVRGHRRSWVEDMKRNCHTRWLQGYLSGLDVRVDELFRSASILELREAPEQVGAAVCEVLDFDSPYGTGTLWFDPVHGYLLAQAEIYHDTARHLMNGVKTEAGHSAYFGLTDASFAQVDGVWFATAATVVTEFDTPKFYDLTTHWMRVTDIVVNPDLDAYRFFSGDEIRNGTRVAFLDPPSRVATESYVWQDGRLTEITPDNDPGNPDNW